MRILLAAKHAPHGSRPIGGVQTWCRTVAAELEKRGYNVETWGPEQSVPLGGFDFGIIANVGDTRRALDWCRKTLVMCHGPIEAERPSIGNGMALDAVAFTSEEIRDKWAQHAPPTATFEQPSTIIRQPIDTEFWSPGWNVRIFLTRFSYRGGLPFVQRVANDLGLRYKQVRGSNQEVVREFLRQSACVLATGRAALEAMSCGVPVVICDHRAAYQGPLLDTDTVGAMKRNYSGRGGVVPTPENVKAAIVKAMDEHAAAIEEVTKIEDADTLRNHVLEHHDVRKIVDQLLEFA